MQHSRLIKNLYERIPNLGKGKIKCRYQADTCICGSLFYVGTVHELFWQLHADSKVHILVADHHLLYIICGSGFTIAA